MECGGKNRGGQLFRLGAASSPRVATTPNASPEVPFTLRFSARRRQSLVAGNSNRVDSLPGPIVRFFRILVAIPLKKHGCRSDFPITRAPRATPGLQARQEQPR